jgi:hypothetical protein
MRSTLDWSHDLLTEDERVLFWRLSVFSGGSTLNAAEEVCAFGEAGTEEILEVLGRLTEQSLVTVSFDTDGSRRSGVLTSSARSHSTRRAPRSTGNWATDLGWRWY